MEHFNRIEIRRKSVDSVQLLTGLKNLFQLWKPSRQSAFVKGCTSRRPEPDKSHLHVEAIAASTGDGPGPHDESEGEFKFEKSRRVVAAYLEYSTHGTNLSVPLYPDSN